MLRNRAWTPATPFLAVALSGALLTASCGGSEDGSSGSGGGDSAAATKTLNIPIRSGGPGSMDPVQGSTTYDNQCTSFVYETLLQYKYLKRPLALEPLLLTEMPVVSNGGKTYSFTLRTDVNFADDECFEGGKGRAITTDDVFYSWKRMADDGNDPKSWWLFEDAIVGFDDYRAEQNAAKTFDYDAPVEGFVKKSDTEFTVELIKPVPRFQWVLAMFQTAVVPREAVEKYGTRFARNPVGSGPYLMEEWVQSQRMTFAKNPNYHPDFYPTEWMPEDEAHGLHEAAGQQLPFADRIDITFFIQDQPMWLEFRSGNLDYAQIPAENYEEAIHKRTNALKPEFVKEGIRYAPAPLLDMIFRGFNMEDELLGGYTEDKVKLRQAIALAIDFEEYNDTFYNSVNVIYDGMIPPGLAGHPEGGRIEGAMRGPDLERAKELLAEAGYPNGEGLPVIDYYTSKAANSQEQAELKKRQLAAIGIQINPILLEFAQLIQKINTKKAPMFSFAWLSDYPDGENNLALFYGPNESPGSNHFNYKNDEYDELYRKILTMEPSPERTEVMVQMRDMVLAHQPFVGSMARTRHYLITPRLANCKPTEDFHNWYKYLDVAKDSARP